MAKKDTSWVLIVCMCLASSSLAQLTMKRESENFSGISGEELVISCSANDYPDTCKFYNPDKQLICPPNDYEYSMYTYENEDCIEDTSVVVLGPVGGECRLRIQSLNPQTHFGEWQCQISSWGEVGSARIRVAKSQAAEIEFVDVWGKVAIDLSKTEGNTFSCQVFAAEGGGPLDSPPGQMSWSLDGKTIKSSRDYQRNEFGHWAQSIDYEGKAGDDGKVLACSIIQGQDLKRDEVTLAVLYVDAEGDTNRPVTAVEGKSATFTKTFKAAPKPEDDQVHWILETPNGPKQLNPGQTMGRFQAGELKSKGGNRYEIDLIIKKVAKWDGEVQHKLVLDLSDTIFDTKEEMPLTIKVEAPPTPPSSAPIRPTIRPIVDETTTTTANATAAVVKEAKSSGVSLYIIIVIVVLVILLCALYYCCKCCKKKKDDEKSKDQEGANAEQSKPLNPSNLETIDETDKNVKGEKEKQKKSLAEQEQKLIAHIEPTASTTATGKEEIKTTNSVLAPLEPTIIEENENIKRMSNQLAEAESNKDDDKKQKAEPITPPGTPNKASPPTSPDDDDKKKWIASPLYISKQDDDTKPLATASPPASPASTKSIKSEDNKSWKSMDEDNFNSKIKDQLDNIIATVRSANEELDSNNLSPSKAKTSAPAVDSSTQTPRLKQRANNVFTFDSDSDKESDAKHPPQSKMK